jgi:hypothetical protein
MNKNKQKISYKTREIKHSFTGTRLTKYAGLSPIMKFINKAKIGKQLSEIFPKGQCNKVQLHPNNTIINIGLASWNKSGNADIKLYC